ncbi:hypothetical protein GLYMA_08G292750v4 [Glycine max]|nr:hypothetical protein GLYMA_08G292750v4 [Glycine max]KAH1053681.1 hypothetical protein GYH30_022782 [Glycine max]
MWKLFPILHCMMLLRQMLGSEVLKAMVKLAYRIIMEGIVDCFDMEVPSS